MEKWEYVVMWKSLRHFPLRQSENVDWESLPFLEKACNEMGEQGWQVASTYFDPRGDDNRGAVVVTFTRKKT